MKGYSLNWLYPFFVYINNTNNIQKENMMIQTTEDIYDLTEKKYLTDLDSWKLKYYSEKKISFDKDEEIANLKLQLMDAQRAVITYRVVEDRKNRKSVMQEHMECLSAISKANDIPDGTKWSYNTETKEIIIDEIEKDV